MDLVIGLIHPSNAAEMHTNTLKILTPKGLYNVLNARSKDSPVDVNAGIQKLMLICFIETHAFLRGWRL